MFIIYYHNSNCVVTPPPSYLDPPYDPPHVLNSILTRCVLIHQNGTNSSEGCQLNFFCSKLSNVK